MEADEPAAAGRSEGHETGSMGSISIGSGDENAQTDTAAAPHSAAANASADAAAAAAETPSSAPSAAEADHPVPDLGLQVLQAPELEPLQVVTPVTPFLLENLEVDARRLSHNLSHLFGGLQANLHALTAITGKYVEIYEDSVNSLSNNVEEAVESMRELVAQGKALSVNMEPVNALVKEIREAKEMLTMLERLCAESSAKPP